MLTVAGVEVEPGQRRTWIESVAIGDHTIGVPIIAVNGTLDGPHVVITGNQ